MFDVVRQRLEDRQLAWLLPDVAAGDFLDVFARSDCEGLIDSVVPRIADFVEEVELGERPTDQGLDNAAAAAAILWDRGRAEEALQLWALLAVAEPGLFEDPGRLRPVAEALPGWIPRPGARRIQGVPDWVGVDALRLPLPPVPPRVVRAADLLADFPHADWIEPLWRAWLGMDDLVRRDAHDEQPERDPRRLMPAQSIAAALGTCAALDRQMQVLVRDEAGRRRRHEALGREVERRNRLVEKFREFVDRYHAGEKVVVEAIRKLQDEIGRCDEEIAGAREALREELTPAALLLHIVADGQAYPLEVRQGAAWGLHRILEDGVREDAAHDRICETLRAVLHDEDLDEAALRDRIAAVLPEGDERVRELLVAAERYAADRDAEELAATVKRSGPDARRSTGHGLVPPRRRPSPITCARCSVGRCSRITASTRSAAI